MEHRVLAILIGAIAIVYPLQIENTIAHALQHQRELLPIVRATAETKAAETYLVWVTAYSSTPEETDETPFTTAMGTDVRDGIIALNFLPFGTRVKIPSLFGDEVFVVEDRMHYRKNGFADIWMPTKQEAAEFGIHRAELVVVE
ncbi:MAG: hypothetical protein AAB601_00530 [Patescibacteria group bacterium]